VTYIRIGNQSIGRPDTDIQSLAIIENNPPHTPKATLSNQEIALSVNNKMAWPLQTRAQELELHALCRGNVGGGLEGTLSRDEGDETGSREGEKL
jgi:hypothetical protein